MKVLVASTNSAKIEAVKLGFKTIYAEMEISVEGVATASGVSDQPTSDNETLLGAIHRVKKICEMKPHGFDYYVGIEGGIEFLSDDTLANFAWIVIASRGNSVYGKSKTATYILPTEIAVLVKKGKLLEEADNEVFTRSGKARTEGTIGALTKGQITRSAYYAPAVALALLPFINREIY